MADYFAQRAEKWDANPVRAAAAQAFYEEILREHPDFTGRTVLEFGCGTGTLGLHLGRDHGARLIFVDSSPAMLEVLSGKLAAAPLAEAQVLEGELPALPLDAASVDVLLCGMALHHVADVPATLRAFRRVLKPGGAVLLADLMPEDGGFHGAAPVPHNGFDPGALAGQFAAAGLAPGAHRVFHRFQKPDANGTPREYALFFLAARAA